MHRSQRTSVRPVSRRGITLLEVLISCGILVLGLTSLSAMLAAAGFRLAQATTEDRAAVAATNALSEARTRGLVAASAFADTNEVLVFGQVLETLAGYGAGPNAQSPWFAGLSAAARARCGSPRTFQLEDDLIYENGQLVGTPVNAFTSQGGTAATRKLRPGVCWGATLTCPPKMPANAGDAGAAAAEGASAELAIAVFKKDTGPMAMQTVVLTKAEDAISYQYEADRGSTLPALRACSWVMAIPATTTAKPRWFRVKASWTLEPLVTSLPRVIFDHQDDFEQLTASTGANSTATVIAFDGLVRLDRHLVTLD